MPEELEVEVESTVDSIPVLSFEEWDELRLAECMDLLLA